MFQIGQKIVCVDASDPHGIKDRFYKWLTKDSIYTVRGIGVPGSVSGGGIFLDEIIGRANNFLGKEWCLKSSRFRPLTECKTDISVFRSLLDLTKQRVSK